jgi:hypothetical protein
VDIRCRTCNHPAFLPAEDPNRGITRVPFARSGREDLASAIARHDTMNLYEPLKRCDQTSCRQLGANRIRHIAAAPHYLRIHLDYFGGEIAGDRWDDNTRNTNTIQIPPIFDLTRHAKTAGADEPAYPMRYKLISVIYHSSATTSSGHNSAGVSRPLTRAEQQHRSTQAKKDKAALKVGAANGSAQDPSHPRATISVTTHALPTSLQPVMRIRCAVIL